MSDTFNGYHVWLGIPANEQPPNHYRLLGIAVFETDLDVIDHAADRQMAHVRTFQSGRHQALSQQILNELANARLCLLSPQRKAEYDEQLRARLGSVPKASPVLMGKPLPVAQAAVPVSPPQTPPVKAIAKAVTAKPVAANSAAGTSVSSAKVSSASTLVSNTGSGATLADELMLDMEPGGEGGFTASSAPMLRPRSKRRLGQGHSSWQRPALMGVLAAVVVMSFMALYVLVHWMSTDDNWRKIFDPSLLEPTAPATAPHDPEAKLSAPPPPSVEDSQE
jgi:hypothetical protein